MAAQQQSEEQKTFSSEDETEETEVRRDEQTKSTENQGRKKHNLFIRNIIPAITGAAAGLSMHAMIRNMPAGENTGNQVETIERKEEKEITEQNRLKLKSRKSIFLLQQKNLLTQRKRPGMPFS